MRSSDDGKGEGRLPFVGVGQAIATEVLDAAPGDTVDDESPAMFDDVVVDEGADPGRWAHGSGTSANFWLRGGRLRVIGPIAALARAERRLSARWALRLGRRL